MSRYVNICVHKASCMGLGPSKRCIRPSISRVGYGVRRFRGGCGTPVFLIARSNSVFSGLGGRFNSVVEVISFSAFVEGCRKGSILDGSSILRGSGGLEKRGCLTGVVLLTGYGCFMNSVARKSGFDCVLGGKGCSSRCVFSLKLCPWG